MLVVIDMQAALASGRRQAPIERVATLLRAANLLDVPVLATEQNPAGLGGTANGLLLEMQAAQLVEKHTFEHPRDTGSDVITARARATLSSTDDAHPGHPFTLHTPAAHEPG